MDTETVLTILGFIVTALSFIGGLITVWVNLSNKLTLLEARLGFGDEKFAAIDKKFDEVMMHLRRIEDKLDNKADRS
jgi:hypothetical protein